MVDYKPLNRFPRHTQRIRPSGRKCVPRMYGGLRTNRFPARRSHRGRSGIEHHLISRGRLCSRGIAFAQGLRHPKRITIPASRNTLTQAFEASVSWEKALDLFTERLRRVRDREGAESLVIGCDPEAGLDFYVGARRFARLWGTPMSTIHGDS